MKIELYIKLF